MGLLTLLLPIISLVSFIGFLLLVRNAFRSSTGWGLAVLFLSPIAALIFAIKDWEESKKPFLIYSGSAVAAVVLMVAVFATMGGLQAMALANEMADSGEMSEEQAAGFMQGQMDRIEASGQLDAEGRANLQHMREMMGEMSGADGSQGAMGDDTPRDMATARPRISDPQATNPAVAEALRMRTRESAHQDADAPAGPIRVKDVGRYVGRAITIVGTDGIETTGVLGRSDGDAVWLERHFSGGTFSVELRKSQIRSLEVLER